MATVARTPAFLVVGATGNTGSGVMENLPSLLQDSKDFKDYRVIAVTRNASSAKAKHFASLPKVEVIEIDWIDITPDWFAEHNVKRIFIASHNGPTHFTDESLFFNYAREAKIDYVVRISTMTVYMSPTTSVYYARNHWAIENLLDQPDFGSLRWTSLRANAFASFIGQIAEGWLARYRRTGKQEPFQLPMDEKAPFALVDSIEVGTIAAHLLVQPDVTTHNKHRYVIVGPENVNGKQITEVLEKHAGAKIESVEYRDTSFVYGLKDQGYPERFLPSLASALTSSWEGQASKEATPTDPAVLSLYAPRNGALKIIDEALASM